MLNYIKGDLLKSDCTVVMHQANCFSTMGSGIARSIAIKYPKAEQADTDFKLEPRKRLGKFTSSVQDNGVTVVNLYGQFTFGAGLQTRYNDLENAIDSFLSQAKADKEINLDKVGVPYKMGCYRAGGDWKVVEEILKRQSKKHGVEIYIYQLNG